MKAIKFRVLDNNAKMFIYFTVKLGEEVFLDPTIFGEELYLYTGLKDKNGTEVYEGDIIIFMVPDWTWSNPQVVQYSHASFATKSGNLWGLGYFADIVHDDNLELLEVIGNIYENPELLK